MFKNLKLSAEELFLIALIQGKKSDINLNLQKAENIERLLKITSKHLLLPLLYYFFKKKQKLIPSDLYKYLKNIYIINKKRNEKLKKDLSKICTEFEKNSINYKLMKGSLNLIDNLYDDIGLRMIGDIDIIVSKNDVEIAASTLNKIGYKSGISYKFKQMRHLPRFISKKSIFSIELHTDLLVLNKSKELTAQEYIYNQSNQDINNLKLCILNHQINDYGYIKATINYRTMYDFNLLVQKVDLKKTSFNSKYFRRFFIKSNFIGLTNISIEEGFYDKIFKIRFVLKKKYKLYFFIDNFVCNIVIFTPIRLIQIVEYILNKNYRNYLFFKIKKVLKNL